MSAPPSSCDGPSILVDAGHLGHPHVDVFLAAEQRPNRRRDRAGLEHASCHLVQQRLEEVVVRLVKEGDADRDMLQPLGGGDAAEPSAHHHDMRRAARVGKRSILGHVYLQRIHFESTLLVEAEHEA